MCENTPQVVWHVYVNTPPPPPYYLNYQTKHKVLSLPYQVSKFGIQNKSIIFNIYTVLSF